MLLGVSAARTRLALGGGCASSSSCLGSMLRRGAALPRSSVGPLAALSPVAPMLSGSLAPQHGRRAASTSSSKKLTLKSDFGPPSPAGQPDPSLGEKRRMLYVVEPEDKKGSFARFMRLAGQQAPLIGASVLLSVAFAAGTLYIPMEFAELLDHASRGEIPWNTGRRLLFATAAVSTLNFVRLAAVGFAGEKIVSDLRSQSFKAVIRQRVAFFDKPENHTGALAARVSMDTNLVGAVLTEGLTKGLKDLAQFIGCLAVMAYFSPVLFAVVASILPPLGIVAGIYGRLLRKMQSKKSDAMANLGVVTEERFANIRTVKAFGKENEEIAYYNDNNKKVHYVSTTMASWNASYHGMLHGGMYLAFYIMVWAGAITISAHELTAGYFFAFVVYTLYAGSSFMGVMNMVSELNKGYGASLRMFELLDSAAKIEEEDTLLKGKKKQISNAKFAFVNVSFAYPERPDVTIFKDLTLSIPPSKLTVVVGSSGSGKSTLAHLLLKTYEPSTGMVTLDGADISSLETRWLRSSIGYVPQEPTLFAGTISQNIAYGAIERKWSDPVDEWLRDAIVVAAKKANAHDFISQLPDGYNTNVGEGGRALSGGQKQRIAIARAMMRGPQLLILDEATSALDSESEGVVQAAIERLVAQARAESSHAVLMFAHRLSMIRQADHVVILKDGLIYNQGPYEEMLQDAYFRQLCGVDSNGDIDPTKNDVHQYEARLLHHKEPIPEDDTGGRIKRGAADAIHGGNSVVGLPDTPMRPAQGAPYSNNLINPTHR